MNHKILRRRAKKVGLPPGSIIYTGNIPEQEIEISIMDYDSNELKEIKHATLEDCLKYLNTPSTTWIEICGIHDSKVVEAIGKRFNLHSLLLEDIVTSGQRAKLDDYKENIYIVLRLLRYCEEKDSTEDEQISLILGPNYVISFCETKQDFYEPVKERIRNKNSRISQRGADYLCYSLVDCIVDNYFLILEKVDEQLEKLETELMEDPTSKTLVKIQRTKREITLLRKNVWPTRGVISQFRRMDSPLIHDTTKLYMQDVYDHTIQAIDTIESFRDLSSGLLDIYLSNINLRMNEVMKVLTVVATIFVPLTFIASIYGMNFDNMPELHSTWGYPVVLIVMLIITILMLYQFRRKRWI